MKLCGVYTLANASNDKLYIGSSQDMNKRIERHFRELSAGCHHNENLQKLWNEEGNLKVTKLLLNDREEAYKLEQEMITYHLKTGRLLNIGRHVKGGDNFTLHPRREEIVKTITETIIDRYRALSETERKEIWGRPGKTNPMYGRTHSADARAKISRCNKGVTRRSGFKLSEERKQLLSKIASQRTGKSNPFYGRTHSAETRKRLREANLGKLPPNTLKVSIDGVVYESFKEASRVLSIPVPTISWRVKSKNPKYVNYFLAT